MEENKMEFETIEPNIWKPEKDGDSIEGVLVKKSRIKGTNKSWAYHLETKEGQMMVWGSIILDDRMSYVNEGDIVRITYKGMTKNKRGQDTKLFKVEKAKPETK